MPTGWRRAAALTLVGLVGLATAAGDARAAPDAQDRCVPLPPRAQVAQLVMSGVPGTVADEDAREVVAHAGSVLLMPENVGSAPQVTRLVEELRAAASADLLVAVDEEGGRVARLGGLDGVPELPPARDLAEQRSPGEVEAAARDLAVGLDALGVDVNLAPVLDVTAAADGTVIGDRAYASDADAVARYGRAFAEGLRAGGVGAVGKHFPGHGRTAVDSHETLPSVSASRAALDASDLAAFRRALSSLDGVMTAHVVVEAIDADLPASLSPEAHRVLREDLGFDGLILTDALEMGAISQQWSAGAAAEQAVSAGADLVVLAGRWQEAAAATSRLVDAVADGRIPRERLHRSVRRVLEAKGFAPTEVSCLLGLPPVAEADGLVATAGGPGTVVDGRLRALPPGWRLGESLVYDPRELDTLDVGAPVACLAGGCGRRVRLAGLVGW